MSLLPPLRRVLSGVAQPLVLLATCVCLTLSTSVGCKSEEVRPDPTRLRTDYTDLKGLLDILDDAVSEMRRHLRLGDYDMVNRHAANVRVYAARLRDYKPEDRPFTEVKRYDQYVKSVDAMAEISGYNARLRRSIDTDESCVRLQGYVKSLRGYLGPMRTSEGQYFEERIDPDPLTLRENSAGDR